MNDYYSDKQQHNSNDNSNNLNKTNQSNFFKGYDASPDAFSLKHQTTTNNDECLNSSSVNGFRNINRHNVDTKISSSKLSSVSQSVIVRSNNEISSLKNHANIIISPNNDSKHNSVIMMTSNKGNIFFKSDSSQKNESMTNNKLTMESCSANSKAKRTQGKELFLGKDNEESYHASFCIDSHQTNAGNPSNILTNQLENFNHHTELSESDEWCQGYLLIAFGSHIAAPLSAHMQTHWKRDRSGMFGCNSDDLISQQPQHHDSLSGEREGLLFQQQQPSSDLLTSVKGGGEGGGMNLNEDNQNDLVDDNAIDFFEERELDVELEDEEELYDDYESLPGFETLSALLTGRWWGGEEVASSFFQHRNDSNDENLSLDDNNEDKEATLETSTTITAPRGTAFEEAEKNHVASPFFIEDDVGMMIDYNNPLDTAVIDINITGMEGLVGKSVATRILADICMFSSTDSLTQDQPQQFGNGGEGLEKIVETNKDIITTAALPSEQFFGKIVELPCEDISCGRGAAARTQSLVEYSTTISQQCKEKHTHDGLYNKGINRRLLGQHVSLSPIVHTLMSSPMAICALIKNCTLIAHPTTFAAIATNIFNIISFYNNTRTAMASVAAMRRRLNDTSVSRWQQQLYQHGLSDKFADVVLDGLNRYNLTRAFTHYICCTRAQVLQDLQALSICMSSSTCGGRRCSSSFPHCVLFLDSHRSCEAIQITVGCGGLEGVLGRKVTTTLSHIHHDGREREAPQLPSLASAVPGLLDPFLEFGECAQSQQQRRFELCVRACFLNFSKRKSDPQGTYDKLSTTGGIDSRLAHEGNRLTSAQTHAMKRDLMTAGFAKRTTTPRDPLNNFFSASSIITGADETLLGESVAALVDHNLSRKDSREMRLLSGVPEMIKPFTLPVRIVGAADSFHPGGGLKNSAHSQKGEDDIPHFPSVLDIGKKIFIPHQKDEGEAGANSGERSTLFSHRGHKIFFDQYLEAIPKDIFCEMMNKRRNRSLGEKKRLGIGMSMNSNRSLELGKVTLPMNEINGVWFQMFTLLGRSHEGAGMDCDVGGSIKMVEGATTGMIRLKPTAAAVFENNMYTVNDGGYAEWLSHDSLDSTLYSRSPSEYEVGNEGKRLNKDDDDLILKKVGSVSPLLDSDKRMSLPKVFTKALRICNKDAFDSQSFKDLAGSKKEMTSHFCQKVKKEDDYDEREEDEEPHRIYDDIVAVMETANTLVSTAASSSLTESKVSLPFNESVSSLPKASTLPRYIHNVNSREDPLGVNKVEFTIFDSFKSDFLQKQQEDNHLNLLTPCTLLLHKETSEIAEKKGTSLPASAIAGWDDQGIRTNLECENNYASVMNGMKKKHNTTSIHNSLSDSGMKNVMEIDSFTTQTDHPFSKSGRVRRRKRRAAKRMPLSYLPVTSPLLRMWCAVGRNMSIFSHSSDVAIADLICNSLASDSIDSGKMFAHDRRDQSAGHLISTVFKQEAKYDFDLKGLDIAKIPYHQQDVLDDIRPSLITEDEESVRENHPTLSPPKLFVKRRFQNIILVSRWRFLYACAVLSRLLSSSIALCCDINGIGYERLSQKQRKHQLSTLIEKTPIIDVSIRPSVVERTQMTFDLPRAIPERVFEPCPPSASSSRFSLECAECHDKLVLDTLESVALFNEEINNALYSVNYVLDDTFWRPMLSFYVLALERKWHQKLLAAPKVIFAFDYLQKKQQRLNEKHEKEEQIGGDESYITLPSTELPRITIFTAIKDRSTK